MKKFIISIFCLLLTESLFAWAPGMINNSSKYQGDNSVINISSGTIKSLTVDDINIWDDLTVGDDLTITDDLTVGDRLNIKGTNNFITGEAITSKWYSNNTKVFETTGASMTVNVPLYLPANSLFLADSRLAYFGTDNDFSMRYLASLNQLQVRNISGDTIVAYQASSVTVNVTAHLAKTNVLFTPGDYGLGFTNSVGGTVGMVIAPQSTSMMNIGSWAKRTSDSCEFKLSTSSMTVNVDLRMGIDKLIYTRDDTKVIMGSDEDYCLGYKSSTDDFRISRGNSLTDYPLLSISDTITSIRTNGTTRVEVTDSSMTVNASLYVGNEYLLNSSQLYFWNSATSQVMRMGEMVDSGFVMAIRLNDGSSNGNLILTPVTNAAKNHGLNTASTDPSFYIYSRTDVASRWDQWGKLTNNTEKFIVDTGTGTPVIGLRCGGSESVEITDSSMTVNVPFMPYSRTTAELIGLAPVSIGCMVFDSTQVKIAIGTGTAVCQWAYTDDYTKGPNNP